MNVNQVFRAIKEGGQHASKQSYNIKNIKHESVLFSHFRSSLSSLSLNNTLNDGGKNKKHIFASWRFAVVVLTHDG